VHAYMSDSFSGCSYNGWSHRLIISEDSGSSAEKQFFLDSIVFVNRSQIVSACSNYLLHPDEREAFAERAWEQFVSRTQSSILMGIPIVQEMIIASSARKERMTRETSPQGSVGSWSHV